MVFVWTPAPILGRSQLSADFIHDIQAFQGQITTTQLCKQLPAPLQKHNHKRASLIRFMPVQQLLMP